MSDEFGLTLKAIRKRKEKLRNFQIFQKQKMRKRIFRNFNSAYFLCTNFYLGVRQVQRVDDGRQKLEYKVVVDEPLFQE